MQKLPVYLYTNSYEVIIDLVLTKEINRIMYQRDLKIQKGIKNVVQLQFKNSDQKFMNVTSSTFVFSMFDNIEHKLLIEKDITILDDGATRALKGLGELVLTESDLEDLEPNHYKFSIKQLDTDNSYVPTYANTYYEVAGSLLLKQDIYAFLKPSQEVTSFQKFYNSDISALRYEWYGDSMNASPEFNGTTALHTMALYMTRYKGKVLIEATLDNNPTVFSNYALIQTLTYNNYTGVDYYNFNGVWSKVRVRYIPDKNPSNMSNDDISYTGTFDKVMYRS